MPQFYEIQFTKDPGFEPDQYGNVTHSVRFVGEKDNVLYTHQPSTSIDPGTKVYGIIEEKTSSAGKTYKKFKKLQVPEDQYNNAPQTVSKAPQGASNVGDGARQGMAINNATQYILQQTEGVRLEPEELADEITRYAKAIYAIDLNKPTQEEQEAKALEILTGM